MRIKFYSVNDLTIGIELERIQAIFENVNYVFDNTINSAIEKYNINKFFEAGLRLNTWTDEKFEKYKKKANLLVKESYTYFGKIIEKNILEELKKLDTNYSQDFITLFQKCDLQKKITEAVFRDILNTNKITPYEIFKYEKIVSKYESVVKDYILANDTAQTIINVYRDTNTLYLPKYFTDEIVFNRILSDFIMKATELDYLLYEICFMKNSKQFPISDKIKFDACKKYDLLRNKHFNENQANFTNFDISFKKGCSDLNFYTENGNFFYKQIFDENWILNNLEYATILNNFIYLFEFTDEQMCFTNVSKKSEKTILEDVLFTRPKNSYESGQIYEFKNKIISSQMNIYYNALLKNNIKLENITEWFFKEYMKTEFNVVNFKIKLSDSDNYAERCVILTCAIESILKQFNLYQKYGEIDYGLIWNTTKNTNYRDIKSLLQNKYIYKCGNKIEKAIHLLFSNQSNLFFLESKKGTYNNFINILLNEKLSVSDFESWQIGELKWLIEEDILVKNENGFIEIKDRVIVNILYELFLNEVISIYYYKSEYQKIFDYLFDKGYIRYGNTLLTDLESDYFSYLLDNKKYSDGFALRNKYAHGSYMGIENEVIHKDNYLVLMRVLVLLIIKINDDFCLSEKLK